MSTLEALTSLGLKVERRIVVKGWKHDGYNNGKYTEFTSHFFYSERSLEIERNRIGEELPDWQPHITEVYVEERVVSDWKKV